MLKIFKFPRPDGAHMKSIPLPVMAPLAGLAILASIGLFPGNALAADPCTEANQNGCVELSPSPPQDTTAIPPNIVLILDDSGSMQWNYMPDSSYLVSGTAYRRNAANNRVYYDPTTEYKPPPRADGTFYPSYDNITNVPLDGLNPSWGWDDVTRHEGTQRGYSNSFAFYHRVNRGSTARPNWHYYFQFATGPINSSQTVWYVSPAGQSCGTLTNCYSENDTSGAVAPAGVRAGTNIANWFAYYRNRILMAKSGLMTAFVDLSPNYRFGFGAINNRNTSNLPNGRYTSSYMTISDVRPFGDGSANSNKAQFWKWLETMDPSGGTPLRRALYSAGLYYETAQPWQTMEGDPNHVPGQNSQEELACRASYTILTTDGFWNGSNPPGAVTGAASSNGVLYTAPDGREARYEAVPPFSGGGATSGASLADIAAHFWKRDLRTGTANLVPTNQNDEAFWQHMTTFTMGIGFEPVPYKDGPVLPVEQIFDWAREGGGSSSPSALAGFEWPTPSSDNVTNIADMAHAGVTGRGDFFSATNPQELADGFAKAIAQISERNVASPPSSSNVSVAVLGALSFEKSYNTSTWNGTLEAVEMKPDGSPGEVKWDITSKLDAALWEQRKVYTSQFEGADCTNPENSTAVFKQGVRFSAGSLGSLDCVQLAGLGSPALAGDQDTLQNRVDYILGDRSREGSLYRRREHRLGAVIHSDPLYVAYPSGGYRNIWPAGSPEASAGEGRRYSDFIVQNAGREGTIYIGANDGMLHAFAAPAPECDYSDSENITCTYGDGGGERWAFIPRAVYANLGNLTSAKDFSFRPTVDATPRSRDVFIGGEWRTLLVGGVRLGGRGVYALDVTKPESFDEKKVLWEFDSDSSVSGPCVSNEGVCRPSDLGYTVPQPNIGRLANGKWVAVVPSGYFPDCTQAVVPTGEAETSDKPRCKAIAAQAPDYGSLFVLDAETGVLIAQLKARAAGVSSIGLGSVVLGDYQNDQIDDVAFAGDLMGNLWRFDLSDPSPSNWKVTLAYRGKTGEGNKQGIQPITAMPRLFPDLRSNRFMVVFGTGKYLGPGDNDLAIPAQAIYGIQEQVDAEGQPISVDSDLLRKQTLTEGEGPGGLSAATLRKLTDEALAANDQGWYIDLDLQTAPGERVVETPAAIHATNTAVFRTLIPSRDNYCDPSTKGALMSLSAANGGSGGGLSMFGGGDYVGGRVTYAATGGSVPIVQDLGGGGVFVPVELEGIGALPGGGRAMITVDSPLWRRRSWSTPEGGE